MQNQFNDLFESDIFQEPIVQEKTVRLKEGERRNVSILFADIHGFTSLSEKLDHEEIQDIIDRLMKLLSQSVEKFGGYVDKYTGDEIMALFGAKVASEVDTQRAIYSALDMHKKIKMFNSYLLSQGLYKNIDIDLSMRIGINTGMVTTGKVGMEREGDFTAYGDTVNIASRLESNAPIGGIMTSQRSKRLVDSYFDFRDEGEIAVKGKLTPVSIFTVIGEKESNQIKSSQYKTPYIGQKKQLETLISTFNNVREDVENKKCRMSTIGITGMAGMGKSRLISEMMNQVLPGIDKSSYFVVATATNISSQSYHMFITMLKNYMQISPADTINIISGKVDATYLTLSEYLVDSEIEYFKNSRPIIGFLLGIKSDDTRLSSRGKELQTHVHIALRVFMETISAKANLDGLPMLFSFEDLHWIDSMSLTALEYIIDTFNLEQSRNNLDKRVPMFMIDSRPEFKLSDRLKEKLEFSSIEMDPLTKEDCLELTEFILEDIELPTEIKDELLIKSSGNPFYIEEWLYLLKKRWKGKEYVFDEKELIIPDNINSIVLSRIDTLNPNVKNCLQHSSVIGVQFYLSILEGLSNELSSDGIVRDGIKDLISSNFINENRVLQDAYLFKHIITRDVAYNTILKSNRKIIHKVVAELLEETFSSSLESFYYELAEHFDKGDVIDKAIIYLELSGEKAARLHDNIKADIFFARLLELDDGSDIDFTTNIKLKLAHILSILTRWDECEELLNEVLEMTKDNLKGRYDWACGDLGNLYFQKGKYDDALKLLLQSKNAADKSKDYLGVAKRNGQLGQILLDMGNIDEAHKVFNEQIVYYEKNNVIDHISDSLNNLGEINLRIGKLDESYDLFNKSYLIAKELNAKYPQSAALGNMGVLHLIRGKFEEAVMIFKEVLVIDTDIGDKKMISQSYCNIGISYKELREYDLALEYYSKQLEICKTIGFKLGISKANNNFATVYNKIGKFDKALNCLKISKKINKDMRNQGEIGNTYGSIAINNIEMGDFDEAFSNLNKAHEIFDKIDDNRMCAMVNSYIVAMYLYKKEYLNAIEYVNKSISVFIDIQDIPSLTKNLIYKAKALFLLDKFDESVKEINSAAKYAKEINDKKSILKLEILNIKIEYRKNNESNKQALDHISVLLLKYKDAADLADIHYLKYLSDQTYKSKQRALQLYKDLYNKIPRYKYIDKINFLSEK